MKNNKTCRTGRIERTELRTGTTKTFENCDHTMTTELYLTPIHYQKEDGTWEEMDDTLREEATEAVCSQLQMEEKQNQPNTAVQIETDRNLQCMTAAVQREKTAPTPLYTNKKGAWQVSFAAQADAKPVVSMKDGIHEISWQIEGAAPAAAYRKDQKHLVYQEILPGLDAEYRPLGEGVKENLILKEGGTAPETFTFLYTTKGLKGCMQGRDVSFCDETDGREVFRFAAPLMKDAAGEYSEQLKMELEEAGAGCWRIRLIPNADWLHEEARVYPITIDPLTTTSLKRTEIEDAHVDNFNYGTNYQTSLFLKTKGGDNIQRSFLKFQLPQLKTGDVVVGAYLQMVSLAEDGKTRSLEVHRVRQTWSSDTITWNNRPIYDETVEDYVTYKGDAQKYVQLDLTNVVKEWYRSGGNYGLMIKAADELSGYTEFLSSDCDDGFQDMRPHISISYRNCSGLEDYWMYHSQSAGRAGTVHINDYSGNVILVRDEAKTGGSRMPMAIGHVYNTNDRTEDVGYGKGFRLNYHQTIDTKDTEVAGYKYRAYTDGDGTKCYFAYDSEKKEWKDEDGKDLTLKINGDSAVEPYVIESKSHTKMVFGKAGHLIRIIDQNDNRLTIDYKEGKIIRVTDGAGRKAALSYTVDESGALQRLEKLTAPDGKVWKFSYTSGWLTEITEPDGEKTKYTYDKKGLLTSAENIDGYGLRYTYDTNNPYRVRSASEYAPEGEGKQLLLTYGWNSTKFTDRDGRVEISRFNSRGNLVHIQDGFGHAAGARYNRSGNHVNCLENTTKLQSNVVQLLKDPLIQAKTCAWKGSATDHGVMEMTINTEASHVKTGARSLCVTGKEATATGFWYQDVTAKKGETYTFSMDVKLAAEEMGEGGFGCLRVKYEEKDGTAVFLDSEHLTGATAGFVRLFVTFTLPSDAKSDTVRVCLLLRNGKGALYGDLAQLESGSTPSRCNLIDNGEFHLGTREGFTGNGTTRLDRLTVPGKAEYVPVQAALCMAEKADLWRYPEESESGKLASIAKGEHVALRGRTADAAGTVWYQVKRKDGTIGYIQSETAVPFAAGGNGMQEGIVAVSNAILRASASESAAPVLEYLPRGSRIGIGAKKTTDGTVWVQIGVSYGTSTRYTGYLKEETICYLGRTYAKGSFISKTTLRKEPDAGAADAGTKAAGETSALHGIVKKADGTCWYALFADGELRYCAEADLDVSVPVRYDPVETETVKEGVAGLDRHIFKMQGVPDKDKKLTKTIDLAGKKGDTFLVNAWGCGHALPLSSDEKRRFGVEVVFVGEDEEGKEKTDVHETNFSPDIQEWQFLSDVYVAKQAYTSIRISYTYCRNANLAYFDGLSLFQEGFGQTYTYDKDNNLIAVTDLQKQTQKFEYNDSQDLTGVTDAKGNSFQYEYDDHHNVTKGTSAENQVVCYTYDSCGNVLKSASVSKDDEKTGTWMTRTMTEDQNRVASVTDARNSCITYTWDEKKDLLMQVKDARNTDTYYTYDGNNRLSAVSKTVKSKGNDQEVKVEYGYTKDRLTKIERNGFSYDFAYDGFGNNTQVSAAGTPVIAYEYEKHNGKLQKTIYGNGDEIRLEYDDEERLRAEYYRRAGSSEETLLRSYEYGKEGSVFRTIDHSSGKAYVMSYDFLDRLMRVRDEKGSLYQYTYDANNQMIKLRHEADGRVRTSLYAYDKDSREVKTTLGGISRSTSYDAWNRIAGQDWKNGDTAIFHVGYEYEDAGTNIIPLVKAVNNGGVRTEYTYDANGNIKTVTENKKTETYTYDGLNRLIREDSQLRSKTVVYDYDAGGNVTEEREYEYTEPGTSVSGSPKKRTTAGYDSVWRDQLKTWGGTKLSYDGCGNLTEKGSTVYSWTQGRKLSGIQKEDGTDICYAYDHTGARVKKTVNGVTTEYRMAGSLLMSERTGNESIWYQYDSSANLIAVILSGVRYSCLRNAQNDIVGLIDKNGKRVVYYKYDSWGNTVSITGSLAERVGKKNPFRYRGYYYDAESGLYYLQSRYYDPEIRRFISADETENLNTDYDVYDKNLYSYCDNNPVVRKDETGNVWIAAVAIGAGVGVIGQYVSDVIGNIESGARGLDMFKITSSKRDYLASAIGGGIAAIPGLNYAGTAATGLLGNLVSDSIKGNIKNGQDVISSAAWGATANLLGCRASKKVAALKVKQVKNMPRVQQKSYINRKLYRGSQANINVNYHNYMSKTTLGKISVVENTLRTFKAGIYSTITSTVAGLFRR